MTVTIRPHPRPAEIPAFSPLPTNGRRPRIGLTTANFGYGGIEFFDRLLMGAIADAGWDVSGVVAATWKWADPRVTDWFRERVPVGAGESDLRALAEASDVVVLSGMADADAWLNSAWPCKTVMVAHGSCEWTRKVVRWSGRADARVAVSQIAATTFPATAGPVEVIHNIPHAGRPTVPRGLVRESWGVRPGQTVVGFLGRWAEEKRPHYLLHALPRLPDDFVVVAVGPYQDTVTRSMRLGAGDRLILAGPTDDAGSALNAFDMLAVPSLYEGFGLVIAEAWAAGVPVVASPVGIVAERPELAKVVPLDAIIAHWAAAIESVPTDPMTPVRASAAQCWAETHLTPERFAREWATVLGALVAA